MWQSDELVRFSLREFPVRTTVIASMLVCGSLLMCAGCGPSSSSSVSAPAKNWYDGGTLHQKTIKEWRSATAEDRLATSGDFVRKLGRYQALPLDLKERAVDMEACISRAIQGLDADQKAVAEIGATCGILLKYKF